MSNWFVAFFFVLASLIGFMGIAVAVFYNTPSGWFAAPGLLLGYWYFTRRYVPSYGDDDDLS